MHEDRVEIGLGIQSDKRGEEYADLAAAAERYGFDVLSVFGDLMFQPPIYPLLEMARATSRVRLGAACMNPYTLHPYEIAGQLAALHEASDGRAYLGVARGTWLDAIGIRPERPLAAVREAVEVVRLLLGGRGDAFEGRVFTLAAGTRLRYRLPDLPPPVLIGTWGPRTARVAGEIADEVKVGGSANPAMVGVMADRIAPGLTRAARRADAVGIVLGAVTVVDEDGAAARTRARAEVAMYLAVVADLDPTVEVPADLLGRIRVLVEREEYARAGACIDDQLLDAFAFSGTPAQVTEQAQRIIDAGARRVEFGTPHGLSDRSGIELLGRKVLPVLDRRG